jgi:deazaflavin-dependent oxidoreductase (nitroreductase family)
MIPEDREGEPRRRGSISRLPRSSSPDDRTRPLLGRRIAHFNRRVTNRLTRPFARWLPGFAVVIHPGRKSKRRYETPVNLFRAADGYVIALTYGPESDWVRNVLAAGRCDVITRGGRQRLTSPEIRHDERQRLVPRPIRPVLRLLRVTDFMHLRAH